MYGLRLPGAAERRSRRLRGRPSPLNELVSAAAPYWRLPVTRTRRRAVVRTMAALTLALLSLDGATEDVDPPVIAAHPAAASVSPATIIIDWCDDDALVSASRSVDLNGTAVTASFTYDVVADPACGAAARSVGTITLQSGQNTIVARIRDAGLNWGEARITMSWEGRAPASVSSK